MKITKIKCPQDEINFWKDESNRNRVALNNAIIYIAKKENKENFEVRDWLFSLTEVDYDRH